MSHLQLHSVNSTHFMFHILPLYSQLTYLTPYPICLCMWLPLAWLTSIECLISKPHPAFIVKIYFWRIVLCFVCFRNTITAVVVVHTHTLDISKNWVISSAINAFLYNVIFFIHTFIQQFKYHLATDIRGKHEWITPSEY